MKKFINKKAILSTAVAAMMAVSAASSLCVSTVCASSFTDYVSTLVHEVSTGDFIIKGKDGTSYTVNKYTGSSVPLNFIGEDGYHYYIDDKCMAKAYISCGTITVFDTSIWNNGRQLTEIAGVPLRDIIHFDMNDEGLGYISDIRTCYEDGWIYDYTMHLHGKAGGNSWNYFYEMEFTDEEGDTYSLRFFDTSYKEHTVDYNSSAYRIKKIEWHA